MLTCIGLKFGVLVREESTGWTCIMSCACLGEPAQETPPDFFDHRVFIIENPRMVRKRSQMISDQSRTVFDVICCFWICSVLSGPRAKPFTVNCFHVFAVGFQLWVHCYGDSQLGCSPYARMSHLFPSRERPRQEQVMMNHTVCFSMHTHLL